MSPTTTIPPSITLPALRTDNPYYDSVVFVFPDGTLSLDRTIGTYTPSANDRYYTVAEGEEIDTIAYEAYQSSKDWWIIADANGIFFPLDIDLGTTLVIPDLNQWQLNNL